MDNTSSPSQLMSNFEVDKAGKRVVVSLNPKIFPLSVITSVSSGFKDKAWAIIDGDTDDEVLVELRPKGDQELEFLAREFNEKLIDASSQQIHVDADNSSLVDQLKSVVDNFVKEERGSVSKSSILSVSALLAALGIGSLFSETAVAGHFCPAGGGDGGSGDTGGGPAGGESDCSGGGGCGGCCGDCSDGGGGCSDGCM